MKQLRKLALFSAIAPIVALAACGQQEAPAPTESPVEAATSAAPDAKPGISASEGRIVLPVVAGSPAAVFFTVRNDGPATATLAGVHVADAGTAEMHKTEGGSMGPVKTVDIAPGASLSFAPGSYHVMAFELADTLKPGGTTELTLTFSDGDKLSMPLKVEKMGDAMGAEDDHGMAGMGH